MNISGTKSKYAAKKMSMKGGSYKGNSPFYNNIPEYQHYLPIDSYPHIKEMNKKLKEIRARRRQRIEFFEEF